MSDDYVEPSSDSFWEIGQYKRTVKRCEEGNRVCNDIMQMIAERADIEKTYSKSLKSWSKKWNEYLNRGSEYGTMKSTWSAALVEADRIADIHLQTHNVLNDELNNEIKQWQKTNYIKSIVNQIKIAKEYEEEFKKAQKPWSKKYTLVEKTKKEYHSACKSYQSAKVQFSNAQNDTAITQEQKKKLEDKVEKYKKEGEITKSKYMHALEDLNGYNSRYIEDMTTVYKKCDQFEKERLDFFIERFLKLHSHLNIYEKMNIKDIYGDFLKTIKQTNPDRDLSNWSKENGTGMGMNWPVFEEYSEELKQIAKGRKTTKDINADSNGVTLASIKHKTDDISVNNNETFDTRSTMSALNDTNHRNMDSTSNNKVSTSNHQSISNNSKESIPNPFGSDEEEEEDSDEETTKNAYNSNTNGHHHNISPVAQNNNNTSSNNNSNNNNNTEIVSNYLNVTVKALYDYNGAEEDELTFKAGEEFIKLANEDDRGWCLGKIGTKIGLYPATYANNA